MDIAEIKRHLEYMEQYDSKYVLKPEQAHWLLQELEKLQNKHKGTETSCAMAWELVEKLQQENERITKQKDNFGSTLASIAAIINVNAIPDLNTADQLLKVISEKTESAFLLDEKYKIS